MKRIAVLTAVSSIALTGSAHAANFAVLTSPPTIMNLVVTLLGLAGVVIGVQLIQTTRGGLLGKAWQIFVAGFVVLVLGQVAILLQTFEIAQLPNWVAPGLTVLWAGIFFYGAFETKRILT